MVTHRIARLLLALAARRWPAAVRAERYREWTAELHVLAAERRHWPMLRYATSLALARPARARVTAAAAGAWRVVRLVLVAPLVAVALLATSLLVTNVIVAWLRSTPFAMALQLPILTLFTLGSAVPLARLGRRRTVAGARTVPLLLAVTVPGFAVGVVFNGIGGHTGKVALHAPAYAVFFAGLGAVLAVVARRAAAGRRSPTAASACRTRPLRRSSRSATWRSWTRTCSSRTPRRRSARSSRRRGGGYRRPAALRTARASAVTQGLACRVPAPPQSTASGEPVFVSAVR